jgi:hypothetical protein
MQNGHFLVILPTSLGIIAMFTCVGQSQISENPSPKAHFLRHEAPDVPTWVGDLNLNGRLFTILFNNELGLGWQLQNSRISYLGKDFRVVDYKLSIEGDTYLLLVHRVLGQNRSEFFSFIRFSAPRGTANWLNIDDYDWRPRIAGIEEFHSNGEGCVFTVAPTNVVEWSSDYRTKATYNLNDIRLKRATHGE